MKRLPMIVCLFVLAACSMGSHAPRSSVEAWATALSLGDYATMERSMADTSHFFYPLWLDSTDRFVEAGQMHLARVAVEQPRGNPCSIVWSLAIR